MTRGKFKRDDIVIESGAGTSTFYLVLTCGPRTYDLIEACGGTTRYRHDQGRHVRLAQDSDYGGTAYQEIVREQLKREAAAARAERKAGARRRRGHVTRYR